MMSNILFFLSKIRVTIQLHTLLQIFSLNYKLKSTVAIACVLESETYLI